MTAKGRKRALLTPAQLRADLAVELLSLCESSGPDGSLVPEEVDALRTWLRDSAGVALPAAQHLRNVVSRAIVDRRVTRAQCRELFHAVEAVLPPEVRALGRCSTESAPADIVPPNPPPSPRSMRAIVAGLIAAAAIVGLALSNHSLQ